ncbi:MAG TPA: PilZ domain-containing protein [Kofleriaceae bacterium]|nr:PilZ domain-containing protein [Kofleriaceae bacterium]
MIPDEGGLTVGDAVSLSVMITSASASYALAGRVVRRDPAARRAVIAFAPGQPHDMLLTQALADADNVPARRARRFRVDLDAMVRDRSNGAEEEPARLIDVSELGCCLQLPLAGEEEMTIGTPVEIAAGPFRVAGNVVWTRRDERGVAFVPGGGNTADGIDRVRAYLHQLALAR